MSIMNQSYWKLIPVDVKTDGATYGSKAFGLGWKFNFPEQCELKSSPRDIFRCRNGLVKPQMVQEVVRFAERGGT